MANTFKYVSQTSNSKRVSTNGYYTGNQIGTVMQDATVTGTEQPYGVEYATVRYGTMAQDATTNSMPAVGVAVTHVLTDCTVDDGNDIYAKDGAVTFTYTADTGKALPNSITVKIGGTTATAGTDYTYTKADGTVEFEADTLSDDTEITITAE